MKNSIFDMEDRIVDAKEAAAMLRCSKTQVYKLLKGEVAGLPVIPHLALGRKKWFACRACRNGLLKTKPMQRKEKHEAEART